MAEFTKYRNVTKMQLLLEACGYTVEQCDGRWAVVTRMRAGLFCREAVYRQAVNRWHFFWEGLDASESAGGPGDRRGGLGDVLDSRGQVRVYERALKHAPEWARISPAIET